MPPELRKRKAPASEPAAATPAKKKSTVAKVVGKVKEAVTPAPKAAKAKASSASKVTVGDTIALEGFGGEIETNDGVKTSLKALVDDSKSGVVLFTYPAASTPGCTKQACMFRDQYTYLTSTGFAIYGLSHDSSKANTNFKEKQKLPYPLLCDPSRSLITAIGLAKAGGKGATRGLFVVDRSGKVLAAAPGSPQGTVEVVQKLVGDDSTASAVVEPKAKVNGAPADVAAEVADTAAKLDADENPAAA